MSESKSTLLGRQPQITKFEASSAFEKPVDEIQKEIMLQERTYVKKELAGRVIDKRKVRALLLQWFQKFHVDKRTNCASIGAL